MTGCIQLLIPGSEYAVWHMTVCIQLLILSDCREVKWSEKVAGCNSRLSR